LYLQSLAETGDIEQLDEEWSERCSFHRKLIETYNRLSEVVPEEVKYAAVKSVYPFTADFKDIDILIFDDDLSILQEVLLDNGFDLVSETPVSFDVVDQQTDIQVDVQTNLAVRRVIYLDKNTIRDNIENTKIDSARLPAADTPADFATIIAHSLIEQLYILKEFYYALQALENMSEEELEKFVSIINANNLEPGCSAFLTITRELSVEAFNRYPDNLDYLLDVYGVSGQEWESLEKSGYDFPHRYSRNTGVLTVANKFYNRTFVKSLLIGLPHLLYPPTFYYLFGEARKRFTRDHYAHEKRYE